MMLGAVLTYDVRPDAGLAARRGAAVGAGAVRAVSGLVVERLAVGRLPAAAPMRGSCPRWRPGIVLDNVVMFTFGKEPRSSPFRRRNRRWRSAGWAWASIRCNC